MQVLNTGGGRAEFTGSDVGVIRHGQLIPLLTEFRINIGMNLLKSDHVSEDGMAGYLGLYTDSNEAWTTASFEDIYTVDPDDGADGEDGGSSDG